MAKRDVVIVGGGPAGLTVARYCAANGLDVLVLERNKSVGSVVRCGEYLAANEEILRMFPHAYELEDLHKCVSGSVMREFDEIVAFSPRGRKYVVPFKGLMTDRPVFERNLAKEAEAQGTEISLGTPVRGLDGNAVLTSGTRVRTRIVVGADGPTSKVAASIGLPRPTERYSAVTTFVEGAVTDNMELYFGRVAPGAYAWIFPKDGSANVGLGVWERYRGSVSELLKAWLKQKKLNGGKIRGKLVPASGPVSPTQKGNVLVVGDAAGHVIPTTGGGMQTSMLGAREAAKAINAHLDSGAPLDGYEAACRDVLTAPLEMGVKIKALADKVFWSDTLTALSMRVLGVEGIGRVLRCHRLFWSTREQ